MKYILFFVILLIFSFFGCNRCSDKKTDEVFQNEIVVGTFNIEWLGDGINDRIVRSEEDYQNIAELIQKSQIELLGVQEVENINAMYRIIKYLPDFSFYVTRDDAPQKVGIIFRKNLKVKYLYDYSPIEVVERKTRPGLIVAVQKGSLDFLVLVVHFKATSRYDDTPEKIAESYKLRSLQAEKASFWADSVLSKGIEQDVLVIGDFNDSPKRIKNNTLIAFLADTNLIFLTYNLKSCRNPNSYGIDHILASKYIASRLVSNSVRVIDTYSMFTKEQVKKISDHCIVLARFEVLGRDNDPSKYFEVNGEISKKYIGLK
ncbi:MAG: endonuclease/exonuclease/phosphatase family protein [Candidatus Kapaibacteriales bacterium]